MGRRLTRPAARLLGCFPSIVDAALVAALVLFNALVFLAYFQGWLGAGWTIDCPDPGFDCEDAPIARASSYLVRLNMGLVWFPVCRNIWAVCRRTGGRGLLSYEQQVALHRWLGYSVVAAVTVHLAGFWIQWLGQGMDVFVDNALPSGTATSARPPVCEQGLCYGICGGGKQDGMGPCGVASSKDCCHISPRKKDGISQAQLPSTGENACICPLEICAGCGALVEPTAAAGDSPTALPTGDLTAPPQEEEQVQHYDVGLYNFYGEVSWLAMLVMFLFGIQSCRRKHWDLFYYLHHLFVLAVIFGVLHDTNLLKVLAPGLSVYVIDKIVRSRRTMNRAKLLRAELIPPTAAAATAKGNGGSGGSSAVLRLSFATKGFGGSDGLRAGQHVQIRCVGVSELQWHPYSIASIWPPSSGAGRLIHEEASFDVFVKDMGPTTWSGQMCARVAAAPDLDAAAKSIGPISVEGPYGGYTSTTVLGDEDPAIVLVAGGIGITPLASLLQALAAAAAGSSNTATVHLWWVCREHERLVTLAEALPALTDAAKALGSRLHVRLFVTGSSAVDANVDDIALIEQELQASETSQLQPTDGTPASAAGTAAADGESGPGAAAAAAVGELESKPVLPAELAAALPVAPVLLRQRPQFVQLFAEVRESLAANVSAAATVGAAGVSSSSSSSVLAVPVQVCGPTAMAEAVLDAAVPVAAPLDGGGGIRVRFDVHTEPFEW